MTSILRRVTAWIRTATATPPTDPGDEDDGDGEEVFPDATVDLELDKNVDNPSPAIGEVVTFTVVVNNQGPSTATGVVVTDQLPSGYTFTGFSTTQGTYNSATGVWTVGTIASGLSETLTITAIVNAGGAYTNLAEVTGINENDIRFYAGQRRGYRMETATSAMIPAMKMMAMELK